jgi:hypothetical protein
MRLHCSALLGKSLIYENNGDDVRLLGAQLRHHFPLAGFTFEESLAGERISLPVCLHS